jgi:hypothetical protein
MLVAVHEEADAAVLLGAAQGVRDQFGIPVAVHQHEIVADVMSSIQLALGSQASERSYQSGMGTDLADALTAAASGQAQRLKG